MQYEFALVARRSLLNSVRPGARGADLDVVKNILDVSYASDRLFPLRKFTKRRFFTCAGAILPIFSCFHIVTSRVCRMQHMIRLPYIVPVKIIFLFEG
jgi:hypothetical protein